MVISLQLNIILDVGRSYCQPNCPTLLKICASAVHHCFDDTQQEWGKWAHVTAYWRVELVLSVVDGGV